ncbi:hypothetical protein ONZ45_g6198 [Pleurotus djamor]|nr:hypothetical protein ONZ45_g6198 [Pleurotus djamor]
MACVKKETDSVALDSPIIGSLGNDGIAKGGCPSLKLSGEIDEAAQYILVKSKEYSALNSRLSMAQEELKRTQAEVRKLVARFVTADEDFKKLKNRVEKCESSLQDTMGWALKEIAVSKETERTIEELRRRLGPVRVVVPKANVEIGAQTKTKEVGKDLLMLKVQDLNLQNVRALFVVSLSYAAFYTAACVAFALLLKIMIIVCRLII